jgi:hypothetical protein
VYSNSIIGDQSFSPFADEGLGNIQTVRHHPLWLVEQPIIITVFPHVVQQSPFLYWKV